MHLKEHLKRTIVRCILEVMKVQRRGIPANTGFQNDVPNLNSTSFTKKEPDAAISTNPSPGAARSTAFVSEIHVANKTHPVKKRFSLSDPAEQTGRMLHPDKKRSQTILAGVSAANSQRAIQEVDFKKNIQDVWVKVKWEQSGKTAYFTEGGGEEKTAFALAYEEAQREWDALRISIAESVEQTETLLAVHNKD